MPISVTCGCGKSLKAKDEFAGRKVRCPGCQAVLQVPTPDSEDEAMRLLLEDSDGPGKESEERVASQPPRPSQDERNEGVTARPAPARRPLPGSSFEEDRPRPPRKKRAEPEGPRVVFEEGWFGSMNAGVVGGLLMILIALVWFFGALALGRIFFYPPILFVIGLGSVFRGLGNRQ